MKKFTFLFLALSFIIGASFAQNADNKWAIGLGPGIYYNNNHAKGGFATEVYLSRYLNPSFDLMLKAENGFNGADVFDWFNPLLSVRYKLFNGYILPEKASFQPYIYGGGGMMWDNQATGFSWDAGIGFKYPLNDNISLYLEGGYKSGIEGSRGANNAPQIPVTVTDDMLKLTGIVEFALGKAKDADGDGVPDRKDDCPDTPPGVQVDENGCPLDRDGDGVPDYKDDCPDEPGSAQLNGCPDRDGDGIADKDDDCPDVPGLAKFNGCPDSDEDGVPDPKDICPDTPKGCPVDANGCPLDSDGDGVIDCQDRCPTEPGSVDNDGCPDWQTLQISSIYFDFDKSEIRPEGYEKLDNLIDQLESSKEYEIEVSGHTDSTGPAEYNMGLSERRALSVVKYLTSKGVNNAYVSSSYYGETRPAVENNTRANRQLNRRVDFDKARVRK